MSDIDSVDVLSSIYFTEKGDGKGYNSIQELRDASSRVIDKVRDAYSRSEKLN